MNCLVISLSTVEYLSYLRDKYLSNISPNYENVRALRISFIKTRNDFMELDRSLSAIHLFDSLGSVSVIMVHIFILVVGNRTFSSVSSILILTTAISAAKLLTHCVIHGKVSEEVEQLFLKLDEIDISLIDENSFKELLHLKSSRCESSFGFTIAGILPFKAITLLSVGFIPNSKHMSLN